MTTLTLGPSLAFDAVAVGDRLPTFVLPITPRVVVQGAAASRDWQPQHHDHAWAQAKTGGDIFLNTPNQAGWIERYLTDWSGSFGRLGRLQFRMRRTVVPGDDLTVNAVVIATGIVDGVGWVDIEVSLTVTADGEDVAAPEMSEPKPTPDASEARGADDLAEPVLATTCVARLALPTADVPNPWERRGDGWQPNTELPTSPESSL